MNSYLYEKESKQHNKYLKSICIFITLIVLSTLIMTITFTFSSAELNQDLFNSYFKSPGIIVMNILPIFIFMLITYILCNRMWLSFLLTNVIFVTASIVNKFKLTYRDDPFTILDIKLFSESMAMTKRYEINFTPKMIGVIIGLIIITVLIKLFFKYKINSKRVRIVTGMVITLITVITFNSIYLDKDRYDNLGDKSLINIWSEPQQFQSKGFVYSFLYSISYAKDNVLENYDEDKSIKDLEQYKYTEIPNNQKVNVIGIMLEAYNDFSKFDTVDIDKEVYENFHQIQEQSIHGKLVTNIFGGGTINTERGFLTGYQSHPRYLTNTNSFVWYLREQGYTTKAMHPMYGWFYNRRNVNECLGFDSFDYYENKYEKLQEGFYGDYDLFDFIIEDYEKSRDKKEPYFNFTVTYQNHGPYDWESTVEKDYLKRKENYYDVDYNIINNYLSGISQTDKALKKLVDYFESEDEPTVLVFFGDHNPWLGKDSTGYDMMDINMDVSTEDGFSNYFETPYVIWGNQKAKDTLNKDFKGEGKDVSPNFLMSELFEYLGWQGNEYMQYVTDLKKDIDVNNKPYFKENGEYTKELSKEGKAKYDDFKNVEYYYGRNFKELNKK